MSQNKIRAFELQSKCVQRPGKIWLESPRERNADHWNYLVLHLCCSTLPSSTLIFSRNKNDLLAQLDELKTELASLRVAKIAGGSANKLGRM
jgi:hypothetical protein